MGTTETISVEDSKTSPQDFLRKLNEEIWHFFQDEFRPNLSGNRIPYTASRKKRKMSQDEFERFKLSVVGLVVVPHNAGMGFNFGITVYDHSPVSGIPLQEPLITVEGGHLPEGMNPRFAGAWEALSPLSHNPENEKFLAYYGLEPLQNQGHYAY
jgi:hypothetical protein